MIDTETTDRIQPPGRWFIVWAWILISVGLCAAFANNFYEMWMRWFPSWKRSHLSVYDRLVEGQSYYTHGPLIPAVSFLIIILLIRHVKIAIRPSRRVGWIVLVSSLLFHLVACLARVNFASGFALIGVLIGLVLVLWGANALRQLWFPIAMLFFMVPLPEVTIARLNFHMKMFAADWGVSIADAMGVIVYRVGNRVFLAGDKTLVIANVCNGLRTLISLLAFGALYAYVCRLRGMWRIFLFALTIPVAIISNSIRIVSLILVADIWDTEIATGWYHDFSGLLIFVLAFLLMFSLERLILWSRRLVGMPAKIVPLFHGRLKDEQDESQFSTMTHSAGSPRGYVVAVLVVLVSVGVWWLNQSVPTSLTQGMVQQAIPEIMTIRKTTYHSYSRGLDEKTLAVLEYPSYICRHYYSEESEHTMDFSLIFSKDNRKGIHPPDLCLQGSGEGIIAKGEVVVDDIEGRSSVQCRELIIQTGTRREYFLYTFKCGDQYTDSFWVQQFVIFKNGILNRNASGALVRVSTPIVVSIDQARKRVAAMLRVTIPHLDKNLP